MIEDALLRRSWIVILQHASLWSNAFSKLDIVRERHVPICLLLHYQENTGVWMASSNRKDLLSCFWIAESPSHIMLNTIMQTVFSLRTTENNGFNICPYLQRVFCMQIRCDFRDGEAECLLHPSFVAGWIKGDLLWFVNMRAFDSDWNETMCRIRLKTMCGEWRLRHVLDLTHPYASAHHCGPIVWPGFCCEVGFCPVFVL